MAVLAPVRVKHLHEMRQRSLKGAVEFEGIGLHTGAMCRMVVKPAPVGSGISFYRRDLFDQQNPLDDRGRIDATPENVIRCVHGTTLANRHGASVATIEHLMAALSIFRIDNADIDIFGSEVPIYDGSAALFLDRLQAAGSVAQSVDRGEFVVNRTFDITDGDRRIVIEPAEAFSLSVSIEFDDCMIGRQSVTATLTNAEEIARLATARTFCRLYEVDALRRAGLIRGGSLENSIVVDGERVLNNTRLRDPDEFALHKALDLIGDFYLLGMPVRGAIHAEKPGHDLNCRAALALYRGMAPGRAVAAGG